MEEEDSEDQLDRAREDWKLMSPVQLKATLGSTQNDAKARGQRQPPSHKAGTWKGKESFPANSGKS